MVVILVIVLLALAVSAGMFFWIRRAASCGRTIDVASSGTPAAVFYGGVMCRYLVTSGSMVRLEFYDWGVRLRGMTLSRWIVPTWEARYDELAIGELVALHSSRVAVWFKLRGKPDGIAFLANGSADILRELEKHDVPVNRSVAQIKRVEELYRT